MILQIEIGEKVNVEGEIRIATKTIKNAEGAFIMLWHAKGSEGGCSLSVWEEWRRGVPQNKRRDL